MSATSDLEAIVAALAAGLEPSPPISDPVVLTSALNSALSGYLSKTGDASGVTVLPTGAATSRFLKDRAADTLSLKDFGAASNGDWTAAVQAAQTSGVSEISLPPGTYPTTLGHYDVVSPVLTGPGQLVVGAAADGSGGVRQAPFRSFLTTAPSRITDGTPEGLFNFDTSHTLQAGYTLVLPDATGPSESQYTLLLSLAQTIRAYDYGAGFQVNLNDQSGGRSGGVADVLYMKHGGQGDLAKSYTNIEVYGDTPGATHFLAKPAGGFDGGDIVASSGSADGKYLQIGEYNIRDNGTAVAVGARVVNYWRTNDGAALHQYWVHDQPISRGSKPIDAFYAPGGAAKRGMDFTPCDFSAGQQAAITLAPEQRIYFGGYANADPIGLRPFATSLGNASMRMGSDGNIYIDPGTGQAVVLANLPTSASGLPTGAIWKDTANGNVLRAV